MPKFPPKGMIRSNTAPGSVYGVTPCAHTAHAVGLVTGLWSLPVVQNPSRIKPLAWSPCTHVRFCPRTLGLVSGSAGIHDATHCSPKERTLEPSATVAVSENSLSSSAGSEPCREAQRARERVNRRWGSASERSRGRRDAMIADASLWQREDDPAMPV